MWQPIETAPRDGTRVWVYYDHAADPYYDPNDASRLTDYAANAESGDFYNGTGQCVAIWQDGFHDDDGPEDPTGGYWIPGGWFPWLHDEASDCVCNATHWQPLPEPPTP